MLTPTVLGGHFCLDPANEFTAGLVECLGQFEDGRQRWLLLAEFEDADICAAQLSLEAKPLLRQSGLLAYLTKNSSEGNRWFQIFLPQSEELSRKHAIMSSHSCRNVTLVVSHS